MDNILHRKLQERIEILFGSRMQTRRDFDNLAVLIQERTGERLSATTLRRFWGYQEQDTDHSPTLHTLNLLSRMVGAQDWTGFQERCSQGIEDEETESSAFIVEDGVLDAGMLNFGERVVLAWAPNRRIEVEYQGSEVWRVVTSENSKLMAGDIFRCRQFVNGEPLYCRDLVRRGMATTDYYCGKRGGIRFTKI